MLLTALFASALVAGSCSQGVHVNCHLWFVLCGCRSRCGWLAAALPGRLGIGRCGGRHCQEDLLERCHLQPIAVHPQLRLAVFQVLEQCRKPAQRGCKI